MTNQITKGLCHCLLMLASFWPSSEINAQNSNEPKQVTATYLLKNAHITARPGQTQFGHILVRDGLIAQVGPNIQAPFDAQVIDLDSMYVYAGFIDAISHAGVAKPEKEERQRVPDPGNPTYEQAGITPDVSVFEVYDASESSVKKARDNGFTIAHVVPRGRMLPGQGGIFSMGEGKASDQMIAENTSMFSQFKSASGVAPGTLIGVMAKYRDVYRNAEALNTYTTKYISNPVGMNRAKPDPAIAAFSPVVKKQQPVYFVANKMLDISRVMRLQKDLGFKLVLADVKQGWQMADKIKMGNFPLILSLDLPEAAKEEKEMSDEEKAKAEKKAKEEEAKMSILEKANAKAKKEREEKKKKSIAQYEQQAAMMEKKGIAFAFTNMSSKPGDARKNISRMIKAGLSEKAALAALTTNAAQMLGISKVAGTLEAGKMAHIVVTEKPLFEEKSAIRYVFVDGNMSEFKKKEEKKGEVNTSALDAIAGIWSYSVEIPGETQTGNIKVEKDGEDALVSISSSDSPDEYDEVTNVNVEEGKLTFDFTAEEQGMQLPLSFDLEIDGNDMKGKVNAGNFGSFPLEATKKDPK